MNGLRYAWTKAEVYDADIICTLQDGEEGEVFLVQNGSRRGVVKEPSEEYGADRFRRLTDVHRLMSPSRRYPTLLWAEDKRIMLEYFEGADLGKYCRQLDERSLRRIVPQICLGIAELHQAGYAHGDIKPSNLIITPEGSVRIIDLGASAPLNVAENHLRISTPGYCSPEQSAESGGAIADDIYSLAKTILDLAKGRDEFSGPVNRMLDACFLPPSDRPSLYALARRFARRAIRLLPPQLQTVAQQEAACRLVC